LSGADAQFSRAIALEDSGRPQDALEEYGKLLASAPQHVDAWHNRGLLLARLGRFAEAERSHRDYCERHPQDPRAHSDLADVLLALGSYEEALGELSTTLRLRPGDVPAQIRRGVALACLARFENARREFTDASARAPQDVARFLQRIAPGAAPDTALSPENIFFTGRYSGQGACDWTGWETYVSQARRVAADPMAVLEPAVGFMMLHLPLSDAERHAILRRVAARIESIVPAMPPPGPRQRQRIRIGVLSPDYYEHLNAYLQRPLFELVDRGRFELYAYSIGPDDGGASRARIRAAADVFRDLRAATDAEAAQIIREDDVDILLDVGGYTTNARFAITAQRPARVQVNYLGFPASLGSGRVDFAIVDPIAAPDQGGWAERLIRLPHTFFLYDYRTTPQETVSHAEYGLPQDAFVFCAFHKAEKITPECFFLWMDILKRVPRSVLWLVRLTRAAENLRRHAAGYGIDPARLVFAEFESRERYLARHRLADLMLDAANHSALTTACDALGMGVPMLTFGGGTAFANRGGESVLRAAGLPELVAADRAAYVEMAVHLASDRSALQALRDRLARNRRSAPLFDTAGRIRELETALEQML
jgi:protein O-GlcNAc transferase